MQDVTEAAEILVPWVQFTLKCALILEAGTVETEISSARKRQTMKVRPCVNLGRGLVYLQGNWVRRGELFSRIPKPFWL